MQPLIFERHYVEKVWGGRSLARRPGIPLPEGVQVGETWEVVDRPRENSRVARGPLSGRTLRELMEERGAEILGTAPAGKEGRFPLLVKYIDAADNLSVQVHPDEEGARRLGPPAEPKTEAWYVLDAQPEGVLYCGLEPDVDRAAFEAVATSPAVVETLVRHPVQAGTCLAVPGGTVHAIGAGVTILEVQQNSDTTYRIWDWGRTGRETHVAQALECIRFGRPAPRPRRLDWGASDVVEEGPHRAAGLAETDFFEMRAHRLEGPRRFSTDGRFRIYAVLEGEGVLEAADHGFEEPLAPGDVWLVPAATGYHRLVPGDSGLTWIEMTSPQR